MRALKIIAVVVVVVLGGLFAGRKFILLHALGWLTDIKHPRAANHPVAWQEGPDHAAAPLAQRPPNIVLILADDFGYNDVSLDGGIPQVPTPNIDAIAHNGVRFALGYSGNAVCSPSRAALMTGRYPTRFGFEFTPTPGNMAKVAPMIYAEEHHRLPVVVHPENAANIGDFNELGVPPSEMTIAEVLKPRGYHSVQIGKWHMGGTKELRPLNQGFDESLFMESGLYLPVNSPEVVNSMQDFDAIDRFLWPNMRYATSYNDGPWFEPKGYLTDYYTDEAVKVIHANRNRPFFLYLAHWAVHTPLQASKADYDALASIPDHRARVYAAMVRALDRSVGRVTQALKDEGLDQNTVVVFTSDNGAPGYIGLPDNNKPFRGWKLTYFEGGVRVPYFAQWPGHIKAGSTLDARVSSLDLLPTFAAAAGAELPKDRVYDGVNLLPYLAGQITTPPHDTIFYRDGSYKMVIDKGWKLQSSERPRKEWLYHLDADPTEQVNLAEKEPARRAELEKLLADHDAQMVPPAWPSFVEFPVRVDKTAVDPESENDEYVYWQN